MHQDKVATKNEDYASVFKEPLSLPGWSTRCQLLLLELLDRILPPRVEPPLEFGEHGKTGYYILRSRI